MTGPSRTSAFQVLVPCALPLWGWCLILTMVIVTIGLLCIGLLEYMEQASFMNSLSIKKQHLYHRHGQAIKPEADPQRKLRRETKKQTLKGNHNNKKENKYMRPARKMNKYEIMQLTTAHIKVSALLSQCVSGSQTTARLAGISVPLRMLLLQPGLQTFSPNCLLARHWAKGLGY